MYYVRRHARQLGLYQSIIWFPYSSCIPSTSGYVCGLSVGNPEELREVLRGEFGVVLMDRRSEGHGIVLNMRVIRSSRLLVRRFHSPFWSFRGQKTSPPPKKNPETLINWMIQINKHSFWYLILQEIQLHNTFFFKPRNCRS